MFDSDQAKWRFLERAPHDDAKNSGIQYVAKALLLAAFKRPRTFAILAAALARDGIRYELDTDRVGGEDLDHPFNALWRGVDDCDAKSRLFCALCLAAGIECRMVPGWRGDRLQHVSAAVRLDGVWEPVELTLARARIGDTPKDVPREKGTGKWART
jgi:transglutaminase-like putative cysteine protease